MDEPLSFLDVARKEEILPYIKRLRDESRIPIVYVSHALAEVARLATQVVRLTDGRVSAVGSVETVLTGVDASAIRETRVTAHDDAAGLTALASRAGLLRLPRLARPVGAVVRIRIRAQDILLALRPPDMLSARNVLPAMVMEVSLKDEPIVEVRLDAGGAILLAQITRDAAHALRIEPGRRVHAIIKAAAVDRSLLGSGAFSRRPDDPLVDV